MKFVNAPTNSLEKDTVYLGPTQKPLELVKYLIKTHSNETNTVLDCFSGSGTTCQETQRSFIGIENNEQYFDKRLNL